MPKFTVFICDGAGKPMKDEVSVHFRQGMKNLPSASVSGGSVEVDLNVDTTQTLAVVASRSKYHDCGLLLNPAELPEQLHMMLVHKKEWFDFDGNYELWERLRERRTAYKGFLDSIPDGKTCSQRLMKNNPESLACFLNILESIRWLPNGPEVIAAMKGMDLVPRSDWKGVQQDRIFIRSNSDLIATLKSPAFVKAEYRMHKGANMGFKETGRFSEANLNFSLKTEGNGPADLVLADVDLDYYEDKGAHIALEVIPNTVSKWTGKPKFTNPARIYAMRWMALQNSPSLPLPAGHDGGRISFDPLFTITAG